MVVVGGGVACERLIFLSFFYLTSFGPAAGGLTGAGQTTDQCPTGSLKPNALCYYICFRVGTSHILQCILKVSMLPVESGETAGVQRWEKMLQVSLYTIFKV